MEADSIINDIMSVTNNAEGIGSNIVNNINIPALLQGYIAQNGLKISQAGLQNIMNNPSIKLGVENAIKSYTMAKIAGNQSNMLSHLGPVVDAILTHTTNTQVSRPDIINDLKNHILNNIQ